VTLGGIYTANLVALGLTPVGVGDPDAFEAQSYDQLFPQGVDLAQVETIGDPYEPNLEAVARLRPDLVIGDEFNEAFYDDLSGVAPTVLVTYGANGGWRERFEAVAEAVGREEQGRAVDAEYQAELDGLPDDVRDQTVAFVRADPDGSFRIDSLPTAFAGSVAEDAGIPTLQPQGIGEFDEGSGFLQLSAENLTVLREADRIVLGDNSAYDPELEDSLAVLQRNPLWSSLPAVQSGAVEQVPGPVYNGGNHYSARLLLQALVD
jgi:ABC-type Fe3+-hydroxamate transport system substrate-binding protein